MQPTFDAALIHDLRLRVIGHNEAHPGAKTKLGDLRKEYIQGYRRRKSGLGAMASVDAYLATLASNSTSANPNSTLPYISVPLSSLPVYESGAVLFAYLAFPEPDADIQRGEAQVALCKLALEAMAEEDSLFKWVPRLIKPGHLMMSDKDVARILRTFDGRIQDRLIAARMAIPFLQQAESGGPPRLPNGVTQLSISQLAEFVLASSSEESPVNLQSRVWSPSLPVIHVAVATEVALHLAHRSGAPRLNVHVLARSSDFIRFVVQEAEKYEPLFTLAPKLELALDRLVRFRLT